MSDKDIRLYHRANVPAHPVSGFHREDIKAMIHKRGSTLRQISIEAGIHKGTTSSALLFPIPKANRAIAAYLGLPLHVLWPQWYDQKGRRIKHKCSPAQNSKTVAPLSHEKNSTTQEDREAAHV